MNTGQAPSLMLDLASTHIREHQRFARERAQSRLARRNRSARKLAGRAR